MEYASGSKQLMVDYNFYSNTLGAGANQLFFTANPEQEQKSRAFFRITHGGKYNYSLLFSNIIDSTYADGSVSRKNRIMPEWRIIKASCARYPSNSFENGIEAIPEDESFEYITFNGCTEKTVESGESFKSDTFEFFAEKGDFICIELEYCGSELPYHEESLLPIYRYENGSWKYDRKMPLPCCIGCDREYKKRIAFFGDSITQGIGTTHNSYLHWNALLSEMLGDRYSYWNLGIGYARADDAASDGIWLEKALMNDIVFVCLGVNDLLQGFSEGEIKDSLVKIVDTLKKSGKTVILQTLPPFDYIGATVEIWQNINEFIKSESAIKADLVFDCVSLLGHPDSPQKARFGGHPNESGCALWAKELYKSTKEAGIL